MANIVSSTAAPFLPQIWASRALDVLRSRIVLANLVTRDIDFEPGWRGKQLNIGYPGTFSAVDKVESSTVTPAAPTGGTTINLTLNKHKVVPFLIEDYANAQANMNLMDRYMEPAVIAIAEQLETDLINTAYLGVTGTAVGTAGTDLSAATVRGAMKNLDIAKAPPDNRFMLVAPKDKAALLGDSNLANYFAFSQPSAIRQDQSANAGFVGELYGMNLYMSQLVQNSYIVSLGSPSAGTFTLTVAGQTTSALAYTATAATVSTAVAGLSTVGTGNVSVTGAAGGPYTVTWTGAIAGNTQVVTGSGASLTGGTFAITTQTDCLALHQRAVILAVRPFQPIPQDAGVQSATATDPVSGLSIRVSQQWSVNDVGQQEAPLAA